MTTTTSPTLMEHEDFRKKYLAFNEKVWNDVVDEKNPFRHSITDGLFNTKEYWQQDIKLIWLLKEAYDVQPPNTHNGHWHISGLYEKRLFGRGATWYPIINIAYSVHNGFRRLKEMRPIRTDENMVKSLEKIAYVNVSKLPAKQGSKTDMKDIFAAFNKYKDLFDEQFRLLAANVIVCANTLPVIFNHFNLKGHCTLKTKSAVGYEKDGRLFIDAKHPSQRTFTKEVYVNDIIKIIEDWHQRLRK